MSTISSAKYYQDNKDNKRSCEWSRSLSKQEKAKRWQ